MQFNGEPLYEQIFPKKLSGDFKTFWKDFTSKELEEVESRAGRCAEVARENSESVEQRNHENHE